MSALECVRGYGVQAFQYAGAGFVAILEAVRQHGSWKDLQTSLKGRDFFRAGPLMRALEYDKPCVLPIDELDKVDEGFEKHLLQHLTRSSATLPPRAFGRITET